MVGGPVGTPQGATAGAVPKQSMHQLEMLSAETVELVGRRRPRLSAIVPAYRDGERIGGNLRRLETALEASGMSWEIIVVVDGDHETFAAAQRCSSPRLKVHGYRDNRGKGFALRYGMTKARGDLVTMIDSDMEIAPEEIGRMAQFLTLYEADMVIGSKRHPMSQVQYPRLRRFQSICYQLMLRVLFQVNLRDTQTGLKMMRREVAERVIQLAVVKRFAFDLELILLAHRLGFRRVLEAPVHITYGFSTTTNLRAAFRVLWDTAAIFYRMKLRRWYDRGDGAGARALITGLPAPIE